MEPTRAFVALLVAIGLILAGVIALPYVAARFTQPRWALGKTLIQLVISLVVVAIFLPSIVGLLALPLAFVFMFRSHSKRVARYAEMNATTNQRSSESTNTVITAPHSKDAFLQGTGDGSA